DWMSALPEELWDISLTNLAIPSHDTMSYCLDINSPLVPSESDSLRLLDKLCHCFVRPTIFKWATTQQDESIEEQLSMGIRYFDLRIAHKPNDPSSDLYFTHVIFTYLTVVETLQSVAAWLDSHPKEIVILACSHFEGIDSRLHQAFIVSLTKVFGSKLCPRKTLRRLWSSGYQVILSYDCETAAGRPELWPAIPYWWANKDTAQGVIRFLDQEKDLGRPSFFVCGLNLTADRCYVAKNPKRSLRTLTFGSWERLRRWLEEQKPGSEPRCLNIIAGDFVGPLPLCSLVIALNQ
uniref:Uncharacterized protein n=1 Tax=Mola mola TaxID=94237 RepID=A0A3Q3W146_MOLML